MFNILKNAILGEEVASTNNSPNSQVVEVCSTEIIQQVTEEKREDYLSWDEFFVGVALLAAQRSKDPNTQVGAVISSPENTVLSVGYNGMPNGCEDDEMPWGKTSTNPLETKYPFVCHAEMNAVLNANGSLKEAIIYVTLFPCNDCAKLIIQAGIKRVIYLEDKPQKLEMKAAKLMFQKAGVEFAAYTPIRSSVILKFD